MKKYFKRLYSISNTSTKVQFVPDVNIDCLPPYVKSKTDECWANVKGINPRNKKQSEKAIGMSLQLLN